MMENKGHSVVPLSGYPRKDSAYNESNRYSNDISSSLLPQESLPTNDPCLMHNVSFKPKLLMLLPLAFHCLGSLAIFLALLCWVDGRALVIDRRPMVKLADGTENSEYLGRYNILQSDVVTILSGALMVLRWVATAWAGPLCWRAIFVLAEKHGVRRRDIDWVTNFGLLPPSTYYRYTSSLLIGTILILTLAPFPSSPLLTGSITWVSGYSTLDLSSASSNYSINYTGTSTGETGWGASVDYGNYFETDVLRRLSLAWSTGRNDGSNIFKRVTGSVANLNVDSTVRDIILPYLEITSLEWLPKPNTTQIEQTLISMSQSSEFPKAFTKAFRPESVTALVDMSPDRPLEVPNNWSLLFNVRRRDVESGSVLTPCEDGALVLPKNSNIPYFNFTKVGPMYMPVGSISCFAYANLVFNVGSGHCRGCRVSSYSTVQNDTALEMVTSGGPNSLTPFFIIILKEMITRLSTLGQFKEILPDLSNDGLDAYARALITRSYSAIWNTYTDMSGYDSPALASSYSPVYPTLTAYVDKPRAYGWLVLQLSLTVAGLVFLWVQGRSKYPLYQGTLMVAFDLNTTEVTRPNSSSKEPNEVFHFEPRETGWKAVVKRSRLSRDGE